MNPALLAVPTPDVVTLVALVVLLVAVASAFVPGAPTGLVSLAGVFIYWWGSGFTDPGTVVLVTLVAVCLLAVLADWLGGVVAARVGGASTLTTLLAGLVGIVLLVFTGPLGMLVGSAATVFAVELWRGRGVGSGAKAAGAYVLGFFASALVQALLAFSVFVAILWVALV